MKRVILHCDMNNYFASVEEKYNPSLRNIPFAVCGDPEMRHNIVMAKNNLAKRSGVITGLSYRQAQEICPGLGYIKANMPRYLEETKAARKIFYKYSDNITPYGMDESWIDLTDTGVTMDQGRQIADLIRLEIMYSQGLSASVGVSDNLIFSKLGSDYKKPNATTVITRDNYRELLWPLAAKALLFVGQKRSHALNTIGIFTIGDIANASPDRLRRLLGKAGHDIWQFANGDDRSFQPQNDKIGSIGNTITPPRDIHSVEEASAVIYLVVTSVCTRLKRHKLKACSISITAKDNRFNITNRQSSTPYPTDSTSFIFNRAYQLFTRHFSWEYPLRSIGVRVDNLIPYEHEQLSLFDPYDEDICVDIDSRVKDLTHKFGQLSIESSAMAQDWN